MFFLLSSLKKALDLAAVRCTLYRPKSALLKIIPGKALVLRRPRMRGEELHQIGDFDLIRIFLIKLILT